MAFTLRSRQFEHEHAIPKRHTCVGNDEAPDLEWSEPPRGTQSFVLIVDDPDAPHRTFVHWLVFDLPASARSLPLGGELPKGARHGANDFGNAKYNGPCPPSGKHRYYFRLHALDLPSLGELGVPNRSTLDAAIGGHILASATLMGTFAKEK